MSPLPVKQVGGSVFVNTSTSPPATCPKAELWENGWYGKNSHILSRDSTIPLQSDPCYEEGCVSLSSQQKEYLPFTAALIHWGRLSKPENPPQLLEIKRNCSFLSHISSEQNKKDPQSHSLLTVVLKIFDLCCA